MADDEASRPFWTAAERALRAPEVETGTMMGFPCLRANGVFFASSERRTGDLIVKLPEPEVQALIAGGEAVPFAPNGRTFREWARIPERDRERWAELIEEALAFARSSA
jgi:hypothetical protein